MSLIDELRLNAPHSEDGDLLRRAADALEAAEVRHEAVLGLREDMLNYIAGGGAYVPTINYWAKRIGWALQGESLEATDGR